MGGCHPTRVLRHEHELIVRVVGVLEAILDDSPDEGALADLEQCVDFFRLFTDACHHGKEEDLLFDALAEQGLSRDDGPIAVMLEEHRAGRSLVAELAGLLGAARAGEAGAWRGVERVGRAYADLIRQHIEKEDQALFDLADEIVDEQRCRRLCEAYDAACARRVEGRTLRELEQIAKGLVERHAT